MPAAEKKGGFDAMQMFNELGALAVDVAENGIVSTPQGNRLSLSKTLMTIGNIGGVRDTMRKERDLAAVDAANQARGRELANMLAESQLSEAQVKVRRRQQMEAAKGVNVSALQALPGTDAGLDAAIAQLPPEDLSALIGQSAQGAVGIGTRQTEAGINAPSMADLRKQAEFFRSPAGQEALSRNPRLAAVVGQVTPIIDSNTFLPPTRRAELAESMINATAGVMRQEQSDLSKTTQASMEMEVFNSTLVMESLATMGELADESMFTYQAKLISGGKNFIDKVGPEKHGAYLDRLEQLRSISHKSLSEYGKSISGGAISAEEMERLRQAWPDFQRDGFNRYHSKRKAMMRSMEARRSLAARWAMGGMTKEGAREIEARIAHQLANEFLIIDSDQNPAPNYASRALDDDITQLDDAALDEELRRLGLDPKAFEVQ